MARRDTAQRSRSRTTRQGGRPGGTNATRLRLELVRALTQLRDEPFILALVPAAHAVAADRISPAVATQTRCSLARIGAARPGGALGSFRPVRCTRWPQSRCRCGWGEPSPGADVRTVSPAPCAGVGEMSLVPVRMWRRRWQHPTDRTPYRRVNQAKGTPHVDSARADSLCRGPQWCPVQGCSKYPVMSRSCSSRTFRIFVSSSSLSAPVPASCSSDEPSKQLLRAACGPGPGPDRPQVVCAAPTGMFWARSHRSGCD